MKFCFKVIFKPPEALFVDAEIYFCTLFESAAGFNFLLFAILDWTAITKKAYPFSAEY